MERTVESITLHRFAGVLVAYGWEADALAGELREMGVTLRRNKRTGRVRAGFPDAEPWRTAALRRLADLRVPVAIVEGEPKDEHRRPASA